ncbi:hypothetical protein F5H01DRAFT_326882 [Linnemannia elongata]|nr:hypothetical protein F5H01DRAFT_326882 [Linnemannia elongata]
MSLRFSAPAAPSFSYSAPAAPSFSYSANPNAPSFSYSANPTAPSFSYSVYPTTTVGTYRTVPESRPTPPVAPIPPNPNPQPALNPTATDSVTTETFQPPPAAKSTSNESPTTTTTTTDDRGTGVQPPSSPSGGQPTIGGVTLQPGSPTTFHNPSGISSTSTPATSGSVISAPMTGVVFTFAFLGALIIRLVAGFLIAKYTRLGGGGGGRSRRQERDALTEQVRLLVDTVGQYNSRNIDDNPQQPDRHDRSYFDEEKFAHASMPNQGERIPFYMNGRQSVASTINAAYGGGDAETERLHSRSIPDQNHYQDWDLANTPLMFRHTAMASPPTGPSITNRDIRPEPSGAGTLLNPRVVHLPPTQLQSDVEIYDPKGEWGSLADIEGGGGGNASRSSIADLNELERRRPQIQVEGEGEESLFNIKHSCHNPHVTAIME